MVDHGPVLEPAQAAPRFGVLGLDVLYRTMPCSAPSTNGPMFGSMRLTLIFPCKVRLSFAMLPVAFATYTSAAHLTSLSAGGSRSRSTVPPRRGGRDNATALPRVADEARRGRAVFRPTFGGRAPAGGGGHLPPRHPRAAPSTPRGLVKRDALWWLVAEWLPRLLPCLSRRPRRHCGLHPLAGRSFATGVSFVPRAFLSGPFFFFFCRCVAWLGPLLFFFAGRRP